jgi:hypothetical protein
MPWPKGLMRKGVRVKVLRESLVFSEEDSPIADFR